MCPRIPFYIYSISGRGEVPFCKKNQNRCTLLHIQSCHHCFATELPQLCMWCTVYNSLGSLFMHTQL
jgi:hypothetical protein